MYFFLISLWIYLFYIIFKLIDLFTIICCFLAGGIKCKRFEMISLTGITNRRQDRYIGIRVSEWLFFNANSAIFQLYHGENNLNFNETMMRSALFWANTLSLIFIVLTDWNNSPWVDMSLHSDTLLAFWFRADQSLFCLLNAACLAEKQQIPIL
jgi:hypothetical protein